MNAAPRLKCLALAGFVSVLVASGCRSYICTHDVQAARATPSESRSGGVVADAALLVVGAVPVVGLAVKLATGAAPDTVM